MLKTAESFTPSTGKIESKRFFNELSRSTTLMLPSSLKYFWNTAISA